MEGLCQKCFAESVPDESESVPKTWRDVCPEMLDPATVYSRGSLYLGNLDHSQFTSPRDVVKLIVKDLDKLHRRPRLERGKGQQSGHGVYWKVFKTFAFAEFKDAADANTVMQNIQSLEFDGRAVVAHPAVYNPHFQDA